MTFSRRDFLRDGAQALSAAALLGVPAFAPAAKTRIEVQDVKRPRAAHRWRWQCGGCAVRRGALLVDGGLAAHSSEVLKAVASATGTQACAHADQHALAPGADRFQRGRGQGRRRHHLA